MHQMETQHRGQEKHLKEQLNQEESTVVALRQESNVKDQHLSKLRSSVKEVCYIF